MKLRTRGWHLRGGLLTCGLTALAAGGAAAQVRVTIPDADHCGACTVSLRLEVTLKPAPGDATLPGRPYPNSIARNSRGRYFVGFPESLGEPVWVFDAGGRYMGKLGRQGEGPGEYRGVRALRITAGDTLRVYDMLLGRVTVYDPGLRMTRTEPAPHSMWDILWLSPGGEVINADIHSAARIGLPLHQVDQQGRITRSFGATDASYSPKRIRQHFRWLSSSPSGFWATSYTNSYRLQQFDASGSEVATLERNARWFPTTSEDWSPTPTRAPAPELWGARQSGDSLLWVLARVADPAWWKGLAPPVRMEGRDIYRWTRYERVFDSVIEGISLRDHRVVAHARFDSVFFAILDGNRAAVARESEDGGIVVAIYGLTLQR